MAKRYEYGRSPGDHPQGNEKNKTACGRRKPGKGKQRQQSGFRKGLDMQGEGGGRRKSREGKKGQGKREDGERKEKGHRNILVLIRPGLPKAAD